MKLLLVAGVMLTLTAASVTGASAQDAVTGASAASRSVTDNVYTTAQASRGQLLYDEVCAECHGAMGSVTPGMARIMDDFLFRADWEGRSLAELYTVTRITMPQAAPNSLSPQQLVDLIAYILSANRFPAGEAALAHDVETLTDIRFDTGQP